MPQDTTSFSELRAIAHRAMLDNGLEPDFSPQVVDQVRRISKAAADAGPQVRDLRQLLWCSIDNDDSRDLDQLSVAQPGAGGAVKILVAIADVDATVARGSPLDDHARNNTTSVYTAAQIFPMLPERLSTDLTCLAEDQERLSIVIDMTIAANGAVSASDIYRAARGEPRQARLQQRGRLARRQGRGAAARRCPSRAWTRSCGCRIRWRSRSSASATDQGALALTTLEAQAVYEGGKLVDLKPDEDNRAKELIEYFMIAANGVVARSWRGISAPRCGACCTRRSAGVASSSSPRRWARRCRRRPMPRRSVNSS